jgi:N-acyl-D-amino-acid deacylase
LSKRTRRRAILAGAGSLATLGVAPDWCARAATVSAVPATGEAFADLAPFDELMLGFVRDQQIPGAQLAVSSEERLVYARGFGVADRGQQRPVQPTDLFRIASISKPITAVATLQLIERNKLEFATRVWELLGLPEPADARCKRITVRHLLQHTGGWDRDKSFDPMFESARIAQALGVAQPVTPKDIIRYMATQPLDFEPGTRDAYSNFGYCLLGRVIEHVTGAAYEEVVPHEVLAPLGIRRMRLGRTAQAKRAATEVTYYVERDHRGNPVPGLTRTGVPLPYGAWSLEAMDSHGGWLASAPDLVRFASAFDVPAACRILKPASIAAMFARPDGRAGFEANGLPRQVYYACGWNVRTLGRDNRINTWHTGHLDGTSTLLVRRFDGRNWAVLFNTHTTPGGKRVALVIDPLLHRAADRVRRWPDVDLFRTSL